MSMMKGFAIFLSLVTGCLLLANAMVHEGGYVLIAYGHMTFESSLWGLLLLLLLALATVWITAGIVRLLLGITTLIYPWSAVARKNRAQRFATRGMVAFTHGHWRKAERLLARAAADGESPLLNYLAAARAAHEAGHPDASAAYLRHADHKAPGADLAIGITQAQLQLAGSQFEQALATLTRLHKKAPAHGYILKLLKKACIGLHDWQTLLALLPQLRKYRVLDSSQYQALEEQAFTALFEQAYRQGRSLASLSEKIQPANTVWQTLNSAQRRDPALLFRYSRCLVKLGAEEKAERLIRDNLVKRYSAPLIQLYGTIKGKDVNKQLLTAESLLPERPNDPELLLALGRLALRNTLWGKAREYFEASLQLHQSIDVYNELGRLLAYLEDHENSSRYFRSGLLLAADNLIAVPQLQHGHEAND